MVPAGWWAPLEEEHRGSRCGSRGAEQGAGRRAQGTAGRGGALTVDLHAEGHTGAACGIAGCAAVVAAVGCAQGLQLEEPALVWELGVGVRL